MTCTMQHIRYIQQYQAMSNCRLSSVPNALLAYRSLMGFEAR